MSKKILRTAASAVSIAAMLVPGLGTVPVLGTKIALGAIIGTGVAVGSSLLLKPGGSARPSAEAGNRLHVSFSLNEPRKFVFGRTAFPTDLRYDAYTGTDQEYYHQIICCASHEVEAIEEIWFDSELAWSSASGVAAKYSSYLQVDVRNPGTSANGIAIDSVWTASCTLTGCAYFRIRYKLTGASKKADSPFSQSIPSRMTVRGKGAKVYDPRFDSTAGGSGPQRLADQTTWAYSTSGIESGRSPALQELFYLYGWRINGKLAIGRGWPAARFDLASFITSANACDESVAKAAGGTEPRYRADGAYSEGDDPLQVMGQLEAAMNADLDDDGGKLSLFVYRNDLSDPNILTLSEDDILGEESWLQTPPLEETPNVVRGRFTDASDAGLYQPSDYPDITVASPDGIERVDPFDPLNVQSGGQTQRLAKQRLQRAQYGGVYRARFNARAWQTGRRKVVKLSHSGLGWSNKLFRVAGYKIGDDGTAPLTLREENAAIYAWSAEEAPAVTAAAPTVYDPAKGPIVKAIADAAAPEGRNLVTNPGAETGDTFGWMDDTTLISGAGGAIATSTAAKRSGSRNFALTKGTTGAGATIVSQAMPVTPGRTYLLRFPLAGSAATAAGAYISLHYSATLPANGFVRLTDTAGGANNVDLLANGPVPAAYAATPPAYQWTCPAGFYWVSIRHSNWVGGPLSTWFDDVEFYELTDYELNADVTSNVGYGPALITVNYDHTGAALAGQLPRIEYYKLFKNGVALTSSVTASYSVISGTFNGFTSASGAQSMTVTAGVAELPINSVGTDTVLLQISMVEGGRTRVAPVDVAKNKAAPPTGGSPGGGTGGTGASDPSLAAFNSTTAAVISDELQFTLGSTATAATLYGDFEVIASTTGGTIAAFNVEAYWERWNGAAWVTQMAAGLNGGATFSSSPDPSVSPEGAEPGALNTGLSWTGLTAGSVQKFRLLAKVTTGSRSTTLVGTAGGLG